MLSDFNTKLGIKTQVKLGYSIELMNKNIHE